MHNMNWIQADLQILDKIQSEFTRDQIDKLKSLHIYTLGDLIALWDIQNLRLRLSNEIGIKTDELDVLIARAKRQFPLEKTNYIKPVDQLTYQRYLDLCHGMKPPEKQRLKPPMELKEGEPAKKYIKDIKCSQINHIDKLYPIRNQGQRGTCVAFGTNCVREFLGNSRSPELSEQFLYCQAKHWEEAEYGGDRNRPGTWIKCAVKALEKDGICPEETWIYNPSPADTEHQGPPPAKAFKEATKYKILEGQEIQANAVNDMREILIGCQNQSGRPISFGIPVFESWVRNPITFATGRIPMPLPGEKHVGGHCMTIVGFNDDDTSPGGGYFIFRNSWGTGWAAQCPYGAGYGTLPYAYIAEYSWEAWTLKLLQRDESVSIKGGSLTKNILIGVFLGLMLVGLLFYPEWNQKLKWGRTGADTSIGRMTVSDAQKTADKESLQRSTQVAKPAEGVTDVLPQKAVTSVDVETTVDAFISDREHNPDNFIDHMGMAARESTEANAFKILPEIFADEESQWKALLAGDPEHLSSYPYAPLFRKSAEQHSLPVQLVLAVAQSSSNFDKNSEIERKIGLMHIHSPDFIREIPIEDLLDPEINIDLGSKTLSELLASSGGDVLPAIIAYKKSLKRAYPASLTRNDLLYSQRLRKYTELVLSGPYEKTKMYPLKKYRDYPTAKAMLDYIEKRTGITLWVGRDHFDYVLFIPAADEDAYQDTKAAIFESVGRISEF